MATALEYAQAITDAFASTNARMPNTEEIRTLIENAPGELLIWFSKGNAAEFSIRARFSRTAETATEFEARADVLFVKSAAAKLDYAKATRLHDDLGDALSAASIVRAWAQANTVTVPKETPRTQVSALRSLFTAWQDAADAYQADPTPENEAARDAARDAFVARAEEVAQS